jgi:hypothetical protein
MGKQPLFPPPVWRRDRDKRFGSRLRVSSLRCRLGRVLDISSGGMRVRGLAWPPLRTYGTMRVRIQGLEKPIEVEVELAWVKSRNPLQREIGFAFTAMTDEARAALEPFFQAAMEQEERVAA